MDVVGEVGVDGGGGEGEAWGPLGDELVDVSEAGVAAEVEVRDELLCGDGWALAQGCWG